jgi:hypothetical protein
MNKKINNRNMKHKENFFKQMSKRNGDFKDEEPAKIQRRDSEGSSQGEIVS